MNADEVVSLPVPHARVAERRARVQQESRDNAAAAVAAFVSSPSDTPPRAVGALASLITSSSPRPSVGYAPPSKPPLILRGIAGSDDDHDARVVLALDYGTTFTGVAYAQSVGRTIDLDDIHVVQNWPGASNVKVPSLISYSNSKMRLAQYGYSIDEDSQILSKTKLELADSTNRGAELTTFTQTLHGLSSLRLDDASAIAGLIPRHLSLNAEDIVQEYLWRIAGVTYDDMVNTLGRAVPEQIPIDMVITHPAKWSEAAMNKTYRAAMAAFSDRFPTIRNVSFVSEPEACAHYTMRAAQKVDHARFRKGDCFIVVDAGGGTVDLASFQISEIDSSRNRLNMKPVGHISGFSCGSTYVDEGFIQVLKRRLDPQDSQKIVDTGPYGDGGHFIWTKEGMQVLKAFLPVKHAFTGDNTSLVEAIPLPRNLGIQDRAERGIHDGNLELKANDIREIFDFSVNKTLSLIDAQINSLDNATPRCRVKSIFLSGGFAKSDYLFSRVSDFVGQQGITVEKGLDCWCAVSKGAVMKGLGLLTERPPAITRSPCFYGIKTRQHFSYWRNADDNVETDPLGVRWATDQIKWFVKKNDAILPGQDHVSTYKCHWLIPAKEFDPPSSSFTFTSRKRNSTHQRRGDPPAPVYRDITFIISSEDEAPSRYKELKLDAAKVTVLHCDMRKVPQTSQMPYERDRERDRNIKCLVQVEVRVSTTEATVTVTSGSTLIYGPQKFPLSRTP